MFAIQILWDTQRELSHSVQIGKKISVKVRESARRRFQQYIDTPGLDKVSATYTKLSEDVASLIVRIEQWTLGDMIQQMINANEQETDSNFKEFQDFSLLCHYLGLCGLMIASI